MEAEAKKLKEQHWEELARVKREASEEKKRAVAEAENVAQAATRARVEATAVSALRQADARREQELQEFAEAARQEKETALLAMEEENERAVRVAVVGARKETEAVMREMEVRAAAHNPSLATIRTHTWSHLCPAALRRASTSRRSLS